MTDTRSSNNISFHGLHNCHGGLCSSPKDLPRANAIPSEFPHLITSPMAWQGSDFDGNDSNRYIYHLTDDNKAEIVLALDHFISLELDGDLVTKDNFPLPVLQQDLARICDELHDGLGFFLIRGLDLSKFSVEDGMVIFLGIQSYIAEERSRQDDSGNMIVHIISESEKVTSRARSLHVRHSKSSIVFHSEESGDICAWQTRCSAARGGKVILSSSHVIYNVLASCRPDVIRTLSLPNWPFEAPHVLCPHYRPILFFEHGRLIINYNPSALLGSASQPRAPHLPALTPTQREALSVVECIAVQAQVKIPTLAGDMHFVNNLALLHRRDEFVDDDDDDGNNGNGGERNKKNKRHLVRMRLRNSQKAWRLPEALREEWRTAFDADEGERCWHLEPMPEGFIALSKAPCT